MNNPLRHAVRRIITRGVIDMATSRILESEGYLYEGPMAFADGLTSDGGRAGDRRLRQTRFAKAGDEAGMDRRG